MSLSSLREAILEIAEEMAKEVENGIDPNMAVYSLKSYSRQIKAACKAVGEDPPVPATPFPNATAASMFLSPEIQHRAEIEKCKQEFRKGKGRVGVEERFMGGDMVQVVGGPANPEGIPTFQNLERDLDERERVDLAGGLYKLCEENGKKLLVYDEESTRKRSQQDMTLISDSTNDELSWKEAARKIRTGD